MNRYRIKLVPDAEPNADGRWIEVQTVRTLDTTWWRAAEMFFLQHIPAHEHLVSYEIVQ
jgi:hypothetical protein